MRRRHVNWDGGYNDECEDENDELTQLQKEHLDYYTRDEGASKYKDCPGCGRMLGKRATVCGHCGHRFGWLSGLFGS